MKSVFKVGSLETSSIPYRLSCTSLVTKKTYLRQATAMQSKLHWVFPPPLLTLLYTTCMNLRVYGIFVKPSTHILPRGKCWPRMIISNTARLSRNGLQLILNMHVSLPPTLLSVTRPRICFPLPLRMSLKPGMLSRTKIFLFSLTTWTKEPAVVSRVWKANRSIWLWNLDRWLLPPSQGYRWLLFNHCLPWAPGRTTRHSLWRSASFFLSLLYSNIYFRIFSNCYYGIGERNSRLRSYRHPHRGLWAFHFSWLERPWFILDRSRNPL